MTLSFPSNFTPPEQNSGPCNSVSYLGHSKMSADDDDDDELKNAYM